MKTFNLLRSILYTSLLVQTSIFSAQGQSLVERRFQVTAEAEALLDLTASAPDTSWVAKGREAATLTIYLDDRYHQDVILFNGSRRFTYRIMLGRLTPGLHSVRIDLNPKQSAPNAGKADIHDTQISLIDRTQPNFQAISHAPFLYARRNTIGRFSDVPLLIYYETQRNGQLTMLRYTAIFSNEDGGTQTSALMARWGRTTDIEWVIETELDTHGNVVKSVYQGVNHGTKSFQGKREADHPLLLTASDNNNFADQGESEMRFALQPIPFDLSGHSREEVMDRSLWIYRVMAEEMIREDKITEERSLGTQIADLRRYLYIDAASNQQGGTALSFAVKLKGNSTWFTSDQGINYNKIDRSGYFRTTIRLPAGTSLDKIERLAARCDVLNNPKSPEEMTKTSASACNLRSVNKAFLLDQNFQPESPLLFHLSPLKLLYGEMIELDPKRRE